MYYIIYSFLVLILGFIFWYFASISLFDFLIPLSISLIYIFIIILNEKNSKINYRFYLLIIVICLSIVLSNIINSCGKCIDFFDYFIPLSFYTLIFVIEILFTRKYLYFIKKYILKNNIYKNLLLIIPVIFINVVFFILFLD